MTIGEEPTLEDARKFLEGLKECFNSMWQSGAVKKKMQEFEEKARSKNPNRRDLQRETYFSNTFVVPTINAYLRERLFDGVESDACKALLAEGYVNFKEIASGTPMSAFKQPFTKQFDTVGRIVKSWWDTSKEPPTPNACPDFALRAPCPFKVVGETKYFRKGRIDAAKSEIVRGIYQCFYYRGLPKANKTANGFPWDYDYACLLAYDASGNDVLAKAWETLNPKVKEACWNSANVFVMVLP
jgi:hypothetical protein